MAKVRDWRDVPEHLARLLQERTGASLETWLAKIKEAKPKTRADLQKWLATQGVTGYSRSLLVWNYFGYPDFLTASAKELIDAQYEDRQQLRPIFDALLSATEELGDASIQARKTYVSLLSPRRTFARIQPTTKSRVDLALRLPDQAPHGRLVASRIHETTPLEIRLTIAQDVDEEVIAWLKHAYEANS